MSTNMQKSGAIVRLNAQAKKHRSVIVLAMLILALVFVYGRLFLEGRARASGISPEVAKLVAQQAGKPLEFPMFHHGGFNRAAFRKMTPAQRHAMWEKRHAQFEAFFLEFARAPAAEQQAVIQKMKVRFKMMHARRKAAGPGNHGGHHGPHGNFAARLPQMMAKGLVSGNPQMHAAMVQFFMAMHNSR